MVTFKPWVQGHTPLFLSIKWSLTYNVNSSVRQNAVRTSLNFSGLLVVFVEIMPDKVILDHKKSYFFISGQFWKFSFFSIFSKNCQWNNHKNENFQNRPNMKFYGLKLLNLAWFP